MSHSGKAFFEIGNDVINMLGADGQADGIGLDALIEQFLLRKLGMGGSRGMNDKRFHIGDVGKQREDFEVVNKPVRLGLNLCASV